MEAIMVVAGILCVAVLGYLFVVLFKGESL